MRIPPNPTYSAIDKSLIATKAAASITAGSILDDTADLDSYKTKYSEAVKKLEFSLKQYSTIKASELQEKMNTASGKDDACLARLKERCPRARYPILLTLFFFLLIRVDSRQGDPIPMCPESILLPSKAEAVIVRVCFAPALLLSARLTPASIASVRGNTTIGALFWNEQTKVTSRTFVGLKVKGAQTPVDLGQTVANLAPTDGSPLVLELIPAASQAETDAELKIMKDARDALVAADAQAARDLQDDQMAEVDA